MQKINYPLIISDFDGTLVQSNGEISQKNKDAIAQYIRDGGAFAISTGRMPSGILPRVKELGLNGFVSCCQGAIVMDIESGETLVQGALSQDNAIAICEKMEEMGLHIHIYDLQNYYANMDDEPLKLYEKGVRVKAIRVLDKPLSQWIREQNLTVYKILAMVEPQKNAMVFDTITNMQLSDCCVTKSAAFLVEVVNANYSKGTALEALAKHYQIPIEKTVAIGDQWNDLPMLTKAGVGLAVRNAATELKQAVAVLPYTNEQDAIAHAIEQYGYTKE